MTHDRGDYRSIYTALFRGRDFRRLAKDPRWLLVALRHNLTASGIDALDAPEAMMMAWTALTPTELPGAFHALQDGGWVEQEDNVLWIVRALEFEPHLSSTNAKHKTYVQRHAASLPRLAIVDRFRQRYPEWFDREAVPSASVPFDSLQIASRSTEPPTTQSQQQSQPTTRTTDREALAYHVRCVIALNSGLLANPDIGKAFREVSASEMQGVVDWEAEGIPVELAERVILAGAQKYRPTPRNRQPSSLRYFDSAVRREFEKHATPSLAPTGLRLPRITA